MSTKYIDGLREGLEKDAGMFSNLARRFRLGKEFPRLALYQQLEGARTAEQLAKLKKTNKIMSAVAGAGGLALLLNLVNGRGATGESRQPAAPTIVHY